MAADQRNAIRVESGRPQRTLSTARSGRSASDFVGVHSKVTEVFNCEARSSRERGEIAVRNYENVVDDLVRWSDVAIAVVPGELHQFKHIESCVRAGSERVL